MENNQGFPFKQADVEIDLHKLISGSAKFLRRNYKIFLITIIIGFALVIGLNRLPKKASYTAYMVAAANLPDSLTDDTVFEILNSIKFSVAQHDVASMQNKLKIQAINCNRITALDFESILTPVDQYSGNNTTMPSWGKLFKLTIKFLPSAFPETIQEQHNFLDSIREGIFKYISDNPYIREHQFYAREINKKLLQEIEIQLKKLDSFEQQILKPVSRQGQIILESDAAYSISSERIKLLERKLRLEKSIAMDKIIMVVEDFNIKKEQTDSLSRSKIVIIFLLVFCVGFIAALYTDKKTNNPQKAPWG